MASELRRPMRVLYLEPYHGGSHAAFTRTLLDGVDAEWVSVTMPARHWKWRMRGAAVHLALKCADAWQTPPDVLFASSYVPLAEVKGLVPVLAQVPAILYFHENQLAYPSQAEADHERDHHFALTQLVSALAAQFCVFNSEYNRRSFLEGGKYLLQKMPDCVPAQWLERIEQKSSILPVPLEVESVDVAGDAHLDEREGGPILLWNHRWEHDKRPDVFFEALEGLIERDVPFRVAVCGQRFRDVPSVFEQARRCLGDRVVHWGYLPSRADYFDLLGRTQMVISTARQEFFGISVLEAVHYGAQPLVPDALSYPELIPAEHRYREPVELVERLADLCRRWVAGEIDLRMDRTAWTTPYRARTVLPRYARLLAQAAQSGI